MGVGAALGLQSFGAGMSTVGAYYNARGQKDTLKAQAGLDDINAKMADLSAQSALLTGQRREQATRMNTAQIKSTQRTAFAANGIDLSSTTPVSVLTTTDAVGEVNAATEAANAARAAFGYQAQSVNFSNRANGARVAAGGINPLTAMGGALVANAAQVADSWYKFKKVGAVGDSSIGPQNDFFARNIGQHNLVSDALY